MAVGSLRAVPFLAVLWSGFVARPGFAQDPIAVTVDEGTNMAAALSPDGTTLAIDALGRIWTLPAGGGAATALTDPAGDARQPAWSPDGARIAFQAYWDGNYHIWSVGAGGSDLRQHTSGAYDHREPQWSPDGRTIVFSSDRGGSYDIWGLDVRSGTIDRITRDAGNEYGPAYDPTGTRIAFVADGESSGIWVREPGGGSHRVAAVPVGDAYAPVWHPDGLRIAYVVITGARSGVYLADADATGGSGRLLTGDDEDVFPFRAAWLDAERFVYTGDGRIQVGATDGGPPERIGFRATVTLDRPDYVRQPRDLDAPGPFAARGIVSPAVSPDGTRVAFAALGDLWVMRIGERPERLTNDAWVETDPAWSPDGRRLVFASDRAGPVNLWIRDMLTGEETQVTRGAGASLPTWSPDGRRIAFAGGGGGPQAGLQVVDVETGAVETVRRGLNGMGRPTWSPDGREVGISAHWRYSTRFREGVNRVMIVPVDVVAADDDDDGPGPGTGWAGDTGGPMAAPVLQTGERVLDYVPHGSVGSRGTDGPIWSPDGRWMAFVSAGVLWAVPVDERGEAQGPPRRLNNEISDDPSWVGDSRSIVYLTADRLRRVWLHDGRIDDVTTDITWRRERRTGRTLIRAGAVFDGRSETVRRNADVVIEGNRIVEVAARDPNRTADRIIDASDGVVMPGLVEMHAHGGLGMGERLGRLWLSYGVTSVRCPACDSYDLVEARESIASGRRVGPRNFGTGGTIDGSRIYYAGAPSLSSTAQVELELGRARALRHDVIKTYVRLPDVVQRRVIADAHAMGVPVTSHELYPAVAFGADGVEHVRGTSRRGYSTKVSELNRSYADVIGLLAASNMTLTPTVGIYGAYGLLLAEDPSLFEDPRVESFFPWAPGAARRPRDLTVTRQLVRVMASTPRRVVEAGGTVVVGTDAPIIPQGLSLHAEMEALVRYGGMRPVDVLRATTSVSAEALGYGETLGTVTAGALADLLVLASNPLDDIQATREIRLVIKDGAVFEVDGLLNRPN